MESGSGLKFQHTFRAHHRFKIFQNLLMSTLIEPATLRSIPLRRYSDDDSKSERGKLLLVAGSARLFGAAILGARAALRCGCGTVRVALPQSVAAAVGTVVPEAMVLPLPETSQGTLALAALDGLRAQFEPCDAAVIGPGMDEDEETTELIRQLAIELPLPCVLDASAIAALAKQACGADKAARVWTPHSGELTTLTDTEVDTVEDREEFATTWSRDNKAVLVWKGRETLIAAPSGEIWKNTAGSKGLGTAGSGDVLAGALGSLLAQGMAAAHAATWAVHLHALAGEAASEGLGDDGLMASDVVNRLPQVIKYLRKATEKVEAKTGFRRD
jgi:NAD(P)H-hydrate epimerase